MKYSLGVAFLRNRGLRTPLLIKGDIKYLQEARNNLKFVLNNLKYFIYKLIVNVVHVYR